MRHVAAYLLATISGDSSQPTADKIKSILGSVGVEADEKQLEIVLQKFANKSPLALIEQGSAFLASMPSGGAPTSGGGAVAAAEPTKGPAKVEKKEEKKEEPEEESDEDMGFGLFD